MVQLLVNKLAEVNQTDESGQSSLHYASQFGHVEIVNLLLAASANVDLSSHRGVGNGGATPLSVSCDEGHVGIVRSLLRARASINQSTENGASPLFFSCQFGRTDVVKVLIANRADVNQACVDADTPLHTGVRTGNQDIVKWLIKEGASVNAVDCFGQTPLRIAMRSNPERIGITRLLTGARAELNVPFEGTRTQRVELFAAMMKLKSMEGSPPVHPSKLNLLRSVQLGSTRAASLTQPLHLGARVSISGLKGPAAQWNGFAGMVVGWCEELKEHEVSLSYSTSDTMSAPTRIQVAPAHLIQIEQSLENVQCFEVAVDAVANFMTMLHETDGFDPVDFGWAYKCLHHVSQRGMVTLAKGVAMLGAQLNVLISCIVEYRQLDTSRMHVRLRGDNFPLLLLTCRPDGEGDSWDAQQRRLYFRAQVSCEAMSVVMVVPSYRKKIAIPSILETLARWIACPAFSESVLDSQLDLALGLLSMSTTESVSKHITKVVKPFFAADSVVDRLTTLSLRHRQGTRLHPDQHSAYGLMMLSKAVNMGLSGESFLSSFTEATKAHSYICNLLGCSAAYCTSVIDICHSTTEASTAASSSSPLGDKFKYCERCQLTRYCSRDCQIWDWNEGGHKRTCVLRESVRE